MKISSLRPVYAEFAYRQALTHLGLTPIEIYPTSFCVVYHCSRDGKELIAKLSPVRSSEQIRRLQVERDLLECLKGHEGVPTLLEFHEGIPAAQITKLLSLLRFGKLDRDSVHVLLRQYIPGKLFNRADRITDKRQQEKLLSLAQACHKAGYAGLDFENPNNLIIDDKSDMHFIDLGVFARRRDVSEGSFKTCADADYEQLRYWFA